MKGLELTMPEKDIRIALFGAHINSTNLGCKALTYSLINLIESISRECGMKISYVVFEYLPNELETERLCAFTHVDKDRIKTVRILPIYKVRSYIKHPLGSFEIINALRTCNVAIDLTAGDSFSDIYGFDRFQYTTEIKKIVEFLKVPLILGPQTYGPFIEKQSEKMAEQVIKKAYRIIARDALSAKCISELGCGKIEYTTDLAFQLPYCCEGEDKSKYEKIKVGINISGLLTNSHIETETEKNFRLKVDYDKYIEGILQFLEKNKMYEVYLISHVEEDYIASNDFYKRHSSVHVIKPFNNPIDVKSYISRMNIFIGARMHATIAALTSGVVTIPTAYSRKFQGLFDVVEYSRIIDLQKLTTSDAISMTVHYIESYKLLEKEVEHSLMICDEYRKKTYNFFSEALESI